MEEPKKFSRLEETQRKLYSKHFKPVHKRAHLNEKEYEMDNDWDPNNNGNTVDLSQKKVEEKPQEYWGPGSGAEQTESKKGGNKTFVTVLMMAMLFFVGSLGYAGYIYYQGTQNISGDDVVVNVIGPVSVGGGEKLSLDVVVQNNNAVALELVDLIIDYPVGTKDYSDLVTDMKRFRTPLGDIQPGTIARETVSAALFGEENSTQEIVASIEYRLPGSNAIFEKDKRFDIVLSASPVRLVVDGLRQISSGQEIELTAQLNSNSIKTLEDVMVIAKYPFGFEFESSDIPPSIGDNIWFFDTLDPEEMVEFGIRGTIQGQNNEERVFRFNTGIKSEEANDELGVVWGTVLHETEINKSFVDLEILVNDSTNEKIVVGSEERVTGVVSFINNTNDILYDIDIKLEIDGGVFDEGSLTVEDGFYSSGNNTISWNSETDEMFEKLDPRGSYRLSFRFDTINLSDAETVITNPEIKLRSLVSATRVSEDDVEEDIDTDTFATLQLKSDVPISIYTAYESGPFSNTGPVPPKADVDTTYTLVFEVSNSTNDLRNVKVEGTLPSYVEWNNMVSPGGLDVVYDEVTRRVIWNVGNVNAGVGYISAPKKMYANVTLVPSISQVGMNPVLIKDTKLTAYDTFIESNITQSLDTTDTKIFNRSLGDGHQFIVE